MRKKLISDFEYFHGKHANLILRFEILSVCTHPNFQYFKLVCLFTTKIFKSDINFFSWGADNQAVTDPGGGHAPPIYLQDY